MRISKNDIEKGITSLMQHSKLKIVLLYIIISFLIFIVGRATSPEPVRRVFCKNEIKEMDLLAEKLRTSNAENDKLSGLIKKMQNDRVDNELKIVKEQEEVCNKSSAEKIKKLKDRYKKAKCSICKRRR